MKCGSRGILTGGLAILVLFAWTGLSFAVEPKSALEADPRWEHGRRELAAGRAAQARAVFDALLKHYPGHPDLYLFQAIALLRLRDPQAAEVNVRQAVAVNPDHVEARTLLGWIESEVNGDFDAAIQDYGRVVELRPDLPEAHNNLGVAQKKKGLLARAAESFDRALALKSDYAAALTNRGWVFAEQDRWTEARRDFEHALKLNPSDDGALYGLSQAFREVRDYPAAQEALARLTSRSANFVYWLEWGRIGLIRYYWVLLVIALGFFFRERLQKKVRTATNGG